MHIPGTINIEPDKQSRALEDATEWKRNPAVFNKIVEIFGKRDIYLFTTRIISNWIDMCLGIRKPEAMAINVLFLTWNNNDFYKFHLSVLWVKY